MPSPYLLSGEMYDAIVDRNRFGLAIVLGVSVLQFCHKDVGHPLPGRGDAVVCRRGQDQIENSWSLTTGFSQQTHKVQLQLPRAWRVPSAMSVADALCQGRGYRLPLGACLLLSIGGVSGAFCRGRVQGG